MTLTRARATALLVGGTALGSYPSRARAQNVPIRIATNPIEMGMPVYYAKELGFFARAGIEVEIQPIQESAAIVAGVLSNAVDIGNAAITVLASTYSKRIPLVAIAPAAEYVSSTMQRTAALVLSQNSTAQRAKDLNGKLVAVNALHNLGEISTRAWADTHGGDSTTLKFAELPIRAMPAALDAGRVDAAFLAEPFIAVATSHGCRVLGYGFDAIAKDFLIAAWASTPQWAADHADLVTRFATAIHETSVWANRNPSQSGELIAKYTKTDSAVVASVTRSHFGEQLTPGLLQPMTDATARYNGFRTFPAAELIYTPPR